MGDCPGSLGWAQCDFKGPYKRDSEGGLTQKSIDAMLLDWVMEN